MRILLTGATGFLGSRIARALFDAGHEITALRRSTSNAWRLGDYAERIEWRTLDPHAAPVVGPGVQCVVHAAASYGRGERPADTLRTNLLFPVELLQSAVDVGVSSFVSTGTALGPEVSHYALTKHQFGEWGDRLTCVSATRFIEARIQLMYGPTDDDWKLVPSLVQGCLRPAASIPLTAGQQRRDVVFVDDVARAIRLLAENPNVRGPVDVGSGTAITIRDLALRVRERTGSSVPLDFGAVPYRTHEVMDAVADPSTLHALGWRPDVSLDDGLDQTIAWYRERLNAGAASFTT